MKALTERANQFLMELGLDKKFSVVEKFDCIEFHITSHGRTLNSGFGVSAFMDSGKIQYGAFKTVYDSGVMYYPDGSGQPPSEEVDYLTEKPSPIPEPEIIVAIQALIAAELDDILHGEAEEYYAREVCVNNDWH